MPVQTDNFEFLDQIYPKKGIYENENDNQILNIQISLGSKFQLQQF